jgi:CRISPR/Cas system-associated exonuclease Cas4 (RecB family)
MADACELWYRDWYVFGHQPQNRFMQFGDACHTGAKAINHAAVNEPSGIDVHRVDEIISGHRGLAQFGSYGWYKDACKGLRRYGEIAHRDRKSIIELEFPVEIKLVIKGVEFKFVGVVDRLDHRQGQLGFWEYKTRGTIPTKEMLRESFQTNIYATLLANHFGYQKPIKVTWCSLLHGVEVDVEIDVQQQMDTLRWIRSYVQELLEKDPHDLKAWRARFNDRCDWCRLHSKCGEYDRSTRFSAGRLIEATPECYDYFRAGFKVFDQNKKIAAGLLKTRVELAGGSVEEKGYRAWLTPHKATVVPATHRPAHTTLAVKRVARVR